MSQNRIWQVGVHPSQALLATCGAERIVYVYAVDNGRTRLQERLADMHTRSIRSVAWKPGQVPALATGSFDATISVWQLEDDKYEFLAALEGHENEVKRVAWSGDGHFLASCSRDKTVWVWEVDSSNEDFECVAVLQDHTQDVKHVAWHPNEELLASASYDNLVRLYRRDDDEFVCVCDLKGHESTVWGCDFEPRKDSYTSGDDMRPASVVARLVSCSDDQTVRVWRRDPSGTNGDVPSGLGGHSLAEEWTLETKLPQVHTDTVYAVKWSHLGIASVGADGRVVIYVCTDGVWTVARVVENAHGVYEINTVDWLDESVVSGGDDGAVRLWGLDGKDGVVENHPSN